MYRWFYQQKDGESVTLGPLKKGWTTRDKQAAVEFVKTIMMMFDCFIAHAVYDDAPVSEVQTFRTFRDQVLKKTEAGRHLIRLYYEYGPEYALSLKASPKFIPHARWCLDRMAQCLRYLDIKDPEKSARLNGLVRMTDCVASLIWKEGESLGIGQYAKVFVPVIWAGGGAGLDR